MPKNIKKNLANILRGYQPKLCFLLFLTCYKLLLSNGSYSSNSCINSSRISAGVNSVNNLNSSLFYNNSS